MISNNQVVDTYANLYFHEYISTMLYSSNFYIPNLSLFQTAKKLIKTYKY